mmetsp:Transcript_38329/g.89254  ORF Transcript_38329/g.89254 Transcript_38329/m.89254 type:complete len:969 (-) Transcript_38329:211-3117(-)|eukprot:CAMPEP_0114124206 /NCGR_PEP_ID=MMETSP0043_2-20121206/8659_1 /TAXON_ID=464988 /ORGANISM="Hemiselmis andersenii, Strain CCMP644" /LENGTH=968 /DNA_ID=CAMNT_0001217081 /DNA_START=60 /DNA_END=2966 /DNA_ORIENTATION=-
MSQMRSEEMNLVQLFIQNDAAHDTLHELGEVGALQFKDMNSDKSAFQRLFVQDVRKCDDMLRILRFTDDMLAKERIKGRNRGATQPGSLQELHDRLSDLEKEMKEHNSSSSLLLKQKSELDEHQFVLKKAAQWMQHKGSIGAAPTVWGDDTGDMAGLMDDAEGQSKQGRKMLGHISGCIPFANLKDFALTLFRATRGNMLLKHEEIGVILDPSKSEMVQKSVFIVFFSGERSKVKVDKIVDSYGGTKYALPDSQQEQQALLANVDERLRDLKIVIDKTDDYRRGKLEQVVDSVPFWTTHVQKEKAVYHTLNKFNYDVTHKCLIAEAWAPTAEMDQIREALRRGTAKSGASVQTVVNIVDTHETPPTFFRNSKYTKGTQAIVDAYGMAKYQEFNPAFFSVITFPFLFGVMFGDIGHGIMMAMGGALLCVYEGKLAHLANDEMFGTLYKGRYNIFLMGVFATYAGFIYNEVFAVPSEMFGSTSWCSGEMTDDPQCMSYPGTSPANMTQKWLRNNIAQAWDFEKGMTTKEEVTWEVYPFGTDPGFAHTANKLNSVNSFKMKFAIIAGVVQMCAGVCTKLMNTLYFKDTITMYFVFGPEIVFINSIFGYLCILIMSKWTTNWDTTFVLNNYEIVSIPQVYCDVTLSNTPCWTPPFYDNRDDLFGGRLSRLPQHMWCMKDGVKTAGCAVYKMSVSSGFYYIVEGNVFANKNIANPLSNFTKAECTMNPYREDGGCSLWKQSPPSLLDTLIKMFMEIGSVPVANQVIAGQGGLQMFLIFLAFVSVPTLLLPKPYLLKAQDEEKKAREAEEARLLHGDEELGQVASEPEAAPEAPPKKEEAGGGHGHGHGEFNFEEEMVHQMIHTIEYVLGCISNTASYLRLWALSLAHAQLSEVFWEKTVVEIGVESADGTMIFVCITAWACFTVGVLMGMESLSAFLHALRLHWVEFMNKFFDGTGYKFAPFSFETMNDEVIE